MDKTIRTGPLSIGNVGNMAVGLGSDLASGQLFVVRFGNGTSLGAMTDRKSVATNLDFTAWDGLMMGRRCGTLDPSVFCIDTTKKV